VIWEKIVGQDQAVDYLRRSAASNRLAHALLFVGPPGVGKRLVAQSLALTLFCERFPETALEACGECRSCRMMLAATHPDYLTLACPEGKSELPIELLVGSRENRGREGLCHDLALRPMAARRRVAVIDDADRMSTECANALLKTLEEPPSYAVIILIAADSAAVLPTIRSRCQMVRFAPLETALVAQLVTELEWAQSPDEAQAAARLSGGSLVVAQQVLDPELRAVRSALFEELSRNNFRPQTLAQIVLGALDRLGGETQKQRNHSQWIVRFIVDFYEQALRDWCTAGRTPESQEPIRPSLSPDAEMAEIIGDALDRCVDAETQLGENVSIPLCLETLMGDLATILERNSPSGSSTSQR